MTAYPYLDRVAGEYGVPAENLVSMFHLEKQFHREILATNGADDRKRQYFELYDQVHRLKEHSAESGEENNPGIYGRLVHCFRQELTGSSVLDYV